MQDLSPAERRLWEAYARGELVDFRVDELGGVPGPRPPEVRAEVLAMLLLGGGPQAEPGRVAALRVAGARVTGRLDLSYAQVTVPVLMHACVFAEPPAMLEAATRTIDLTGSVLPGLEARGLRIDGGLVLSECVIDGEVQLRGARVDGALYLQRARVSRPGERAANLDNIVVEGDLAAHDVAIQGELRMQNARIGGRLLLRAARLTNPDGHALFAGGLVVEGGAFLVGGFIAEGEIRLIGARFQANLTMRGVRLSAPGRCALNLDHAVMSSSLALAGDFTAEGEIRLNGAQVEGPLLLNGARLLGAAPRNGPQWRANITVAALDEAVPKVHPPGEGDAAEQAAPEAEPHDGEPDSVEEGGGPRALTADSLSVGGNLEMQHGFHALGAIRLRTARIGGRLEMYRARVENPGAIALRLSRADIGSDFFCGEMTVAGETRLAGTKIGGRADLRGVTLRAWANIGGRLVPAEDEAALIAPFLEVSELDLLPAEVQGRVVLRHARVGVLRDNETVRAATVELDGLTYETLEPRLSAAERLRWLGRDARGYHPAPYEQLAALYERLGDQTDARRVLLQRERMRRRTLTPLGRMWGLLQDGVVAYGYQPWRAAFWLALLVTVGSVAYALNEPQPLKADEAPPFNPVGYTLDLLLPFVNLGQEQAYGPAGALQWLSYALIAAGWVLVTTIAAGAARILTRR